MRRRRRWTIGVDVGLRHAHRTAATRHVGLRSKRLVGRCCWRARFRRRMNRDPRQATRSCFGRDRRKGRSRRRRSRFRFGGFCGRGFGGSRFNRLARCRTRERRERNKRIWFGRRDPGRLRRSMRQQRQIGNIGRSGAQRIASPDRRRHWLRQRRQGRKCRYRGYLWRRGRGRFSQRIRIFRRCRRARWWIDGRQRRGKLRLRELRWCECRRSSVGRWHEVGDRTRGNRRRRCNRWRGTGCQRNRRGRGWRPKRQTVRLGGISKRR